MIKQELVQVRDAEDLRQLQAYQGDLNVPELLPEEIHGRVVAWWTDRWEYEQWKSARAAESNTDNPRADDHG